MTNGKLGTICFGQGTDRNCILRVQSDTIVIKYKTFIMSIVGLYADKNSRDNNPESRVIQRWLPYTLQLIQSCHQCLRLLHSHRHIFILITQNVLQLTKLTKSAHSNNGIHFLEHQELNYEHANLHGDR